MITLPKDWANSVGLNKNDTVGVQAQPDGTLVLCPKGSLPVEKRSTKVIDATNIKNRELFKRQLVGAYIAGHTTIIVKSSQPMTKDVTSVVAEFVQDAVGLEMIEADESHILIVNLIEHDAIDTTKIVERMGSLVKNMFTDLSNAALTGDPSKIKDMAVRDTEIDRIYWLTFRQYNMSQRDTVGAHKTKPPNHKITTCLFVSRVLENLGDHAVYLSKFIAAFNEYSGHITIDKRLFVFDQRATDLFAKVLKSWADMDIQLANQAINESDEISSDCVQAITRYGPNNEHNVLDGIVLLSVKKISEMCKVIAEYTIDVSMD